MPGRVESQKHVLLSIGRVTFSPINRVAIGIMARREPQHAQDFKMYCVLVTNYGFPLDGFVRELPAAAAERLLFPAVVGVFLAAADARLLPPLA